MKLFVIMFFILVSIVNTQLYAETHFDLGRCKRCFGHVCRITFIFQKDANVLNSVRSCLCLKNHIGGINCNIDESFEIDIWKRKIKIG